MRKLVVILLAVMLLATGLIGGCNKDKQNVNFKTEIDWKTFDMTTGTVVEGLDSIDLFTDGIKNFESAEYFEKDVLTDGGAIVASIDASQSIYDIYKRAGNEYFHQKTAYGKSFLAPIFEGKRYYFDGTKGYEYINDKFTKDYTSADQILTPDFSVATYTDFTGDTTAKNKGIQDFGSYVIEKSRLASDYNKNVYLIDGYYYIDVAIDCLEQGQDDVKQVIVNALNCTDFVWKNNSVFKCQLKKDGEKYFITSYILYENYQGKSKGVTVEVKQTVTVNNKYGQDNVSILDSEKKK